jgi:hypothetical protein
MSRHVGAFHWPLNGRLLRLVSQLGGRKTEKVTQPTTRTRFETEHRNRSPDEVRERSEHGPHRTEGRGQNACAQYSSRQPRPKVAALSPATANYRARCAYASGQDSQCRPRRLRGRCRGSRGRGSVAGKDGGNAGVRPNLVGKLGRGSRHCGDRVFATHAEDAASIIGLVELGEAGVPVIHVFRFVRAGRRGRPQQKRESNECLRTA